MNTVIQGRGTRCATLLAAAGLLCAGCTVMPTGPSVLALPGSGKSVEQYQADVTACQQHADAVTAANSGVAAGADNSAAASAASAAVFGAAVGALIGSATGQVGEGAAIGATTGLLFGGAAGSSHTARSSHQLQRGYDGAYLQCMYSRGNRVPQAQGRGSAPSRPSYLGPSAAPGSYPPPANVPPSSYPPPDAPPPSGLPPRT